MRRISLLLTVAAMALAATGAASASGKPSYGCPPGFNMDAVGFADYLTLERTEAAIDAGLATEQDILDSLSRVDRNGNEFVCVQLSRGKIEGNNPFGQYLYNVVDDNASTP
jgi:hypothetical protein